jgi:hypothetical protein
LRKLVDLAQTGQRFPTLERVLSKGRHFRARASSPDHFRFHLFGIEAEGQLPVAALTRAGDSGQRPERNQYWLRTDPVTLWADMARVVIAGYGLVDLDEFDRNEIEITVRSVLMEEGIHLHADHPERWCIALKEPMAESFPPVSEALGMDLSEVMQDNPESMHWRRIMNEIEIALHSCPVNARRRQAGLHEINSVWFWGGGFIPEASEHDAFDAVYSDHPVSRGLSAINDCKLRTQAECNLAGLDPDDLTVLIDWAADLERPDASLFELESLLDRILSQMNNNQSDRLILYCGRDDGWRFGADSKWRWWRRTQTLDELCNKRYPA